MTATHTLYQAVDSLLARSWFKVSSLKISVHCTCDIGVKQ